MNRKITYSHSGMIMCLLLVWQSTVMPTTSIAIPLTNFTGHSENLSSVVNFAVLPPGDAFTDMLTPYYQGANGSSATLNPAHFTYLYQVTNQLSPPSVFSQLSDFAVRNPGGTGGGRVTTMGTFNPPGLRVDFLDQGRVVDASGLRGIDRFGFSGCDFGRCRGDGPGGDLDGAKGFGLAVRQAASSPVTVRTSGQGLSWKFSGLASGLTSPLFGYQSPEGPGLAFGAESFILGVGETVLVPGATAPEPLSLLIMASGLLGLVWWHTRITQA